ncbi:DUF255 domain-containing protein [candidate division KSB1 bacterium]|nr:DUF255 domain-containing protein [candidate division KSB1 bacterium]
MRQQINKNYIFQGLILVTLLVFASVNFAADNKWHSFNEGLEKADKENKMILIDFYADWCHWCKVMDQKTFQDKQVAQKLQERFVTIKLDAEDAGSKVNYRNETYSNPQLTRAFGVTGFPSLAFLDSNGDVITLVPGYVPPENFINILNYIDARCWEKEVSFEDFLKNKDCGKKEL